MAKGYCIVAAGCSLTYASYYWLGCGNAARGRYTRARGRSHIDHMGRMVKIGQFGQFFDHFPVLNAIGRFGGVL